MLRDLTKLQICDTKPFGEGAFSKVVRCKVMEDDRLYALKIVC